tara:strand:- start:88 stop:273 length:186 start_codon:yes stop_codon:yes gene_type:complete
LSEDTIPPPEPPARLAALPLAQPPPPPVDVIVEKDESFPVEPVFAYGEDAPEFPPPPTVTV